MKRVRSLVDYLDHYNSVPDILGRKCAALLNGNLLDGTDDDPIGMIEGRFRPDDDIGQLIRWIHPHYVWADRRSLFFQQWYQRGITFVFERVVVGRRRGRHRAGLRVAPRVVRPRSRSPDLRPGRRPLRSSDRDA